MASDDESDDDNDKKKEDDDEEEVRLLVAKLLWSKYTTNIHLKEFRLNFSNIFSASRP